MDYKITNLTEEVECNQQIFEDFNGLTVGRLADNDAVFDATAYCEANGLETADYRSFSRTNKRYIEALIKSGQIKREKMFYLNTNGHLLVNISLAYLFLAFYVSDIYVYFDSLINDIITDGVAFSDNYVVRLASERVPSEMLQTIIESRK